MNGRRRRGRAATAQRVTTSTFFINITNGFPREIPDKFLEQLTFGSVIKVIINEPLFNF